MPIGSITGVVCCGNISYDIPVWPVENFNWGTTTWVEAIGHNVGGNGGNTSIALALLGTPVRLFGCVGSDLHGDTLMADLRAAGVDVAGVVRSEKQTTSTVCLVHKSGDRMFLHRPGSSRDVKPDMVSFDGSEGFSHFHMANPFALPVVRQDTAGLLRRARAAGLTTSLDTGWDALGRWMEDIGPCLPEVDLMFVNESEALMLGGHEDPDLAAASLRSAGVRDVVIKLGGRGSITYWGELRIETPAFETEVLDTTGAGDCFAAGFLAALHRGMPPEEAARIANAAGGMSVSRIGTVTGLGSWEDTMRWISFHRIRGDC